MPNDEIIKSAERGPLRKGKNDLIKHLKGQRLTQRQAIRAKCFDCNGMGELGTCEIQTCALWPYSPYRQIPTTA